MHIYIHRCINKYIDLSIKEMIEMVQDMMGCFGGVVNSIGSNDKSVSTNQAK